MVRRLRLECDLHKPTTRRLHVRLSYNQYPVCDCNNNNNNKNFLLNSEFNINWMLSIRRSKLFPCAQVTLGGVDESKCVETWTNILSGWFCVCQKNDDASRHWWGFPMEIDLSDQSKKRFNQLYILNINNQIARLIQQKCNFANRFEWIWGNKCWKRFDGWPKGLKLIYLIQ